MTSDVRRGTECCVCEDETDLRQGLAVYEDILVADDALQPWGGMAACEACYTLWQVGVFKAGMTFDEARELLRLRLVEAMVST